ncbi:MAG: sulfurtransferase complex subunit TusB [Candidatus Bathyarchaeia archaeon]
MRSILVIISSSQNTQNAARALKLASTLNEQGNKVSVFLLQDGTYCAHSKQSQEAKAAIDKALAEGIDIYVMEEDVIARGFRGEDLIPKIRASDYPELVDLMMERHDLVMGTF